MTDEQVQAIRARYEAALEAGLTDAVFMEIDTEAQSVFYEHVMDDMRDLLAERERLQAVVEAARVLLTNDDRDGLQVTISYRALEAFKQVVAALDGREGV